MRLSAGTKLGRYEIRSKIGEGGMGEVYLAQDTSELGRMVALKIVSAEVANDTDRLQRFTQEARTVSNLNHPNILTIYEFSQANSVWFIATEFVDGETLRERMRREPLNVTEALKIAIQMASALTAAHESGIVHRDIKPENVMLRRDEIVKVLDFGVAKVAEPTGSDLDAATLVKTAPGIILGSIHYMSPEQARGLPVDSRSDIWSLGAVLYEMLAGRKPFEAATVSDVMAAILTREPPPLQSLTNVPAAVERAVSKCMAKAVTDRYQSADVLAADLRIVKLELQSPSTLVEPAAGHPTSEAERPADTAKRSAVTTTENHPNNLSGQITPVIGRTAEIAEIKRILQDDGQRLLTLTGPGGTGKTRLAVQVAADLLSEFADGVFLVSLGSINERALVASEIAQTLGLKETGDTPIRETLKSHLHSRQMLLVLDNFEQVVAAATLVSELLSACPQLKILVTSRVVLHVRGEQELPVQPLDLPDVHRLPPLASLCDYSAVKLFVDRARAIKPDFVLTDNNAQAVAEICAHLDGLPLAIELAAARIKLLSPKSMVARLDNRLKLLVGGASDLPEHQQTMRTTIDWSYDLLNAQEQKLFEWLSVFASGFTLQAAESIAGDKLQLDVLEGLLSLVNQSLIRQKEEPAGDPRFWLLEIIREYGSEKLHASAELPALYRAHANYFVSLAERAEPELTGADQAAWLNQLESEHENIRAALKFLLDSGDGETAARLAAAFWRFWLVRGYLSEGRQQLQRIASAAVAADTRAKILMGAGTLAQNQTDYSAARSLFEESLAIWRQIGNKKGIATLLHNLGWMAWRQSDYDTAHRLSAEALALHREIGNKLGMAHSLNNLGWVAHHRGDYAAAQDFHEQSLAIRRELGDQRAVAFALTNLGWAVQKQGDYERSLSLIREARESFREVGDKQLLAFSSLIMANALHEYGDPPEAKKLLNHSIKTSNEIGSKYNLAFSLRILGDVMLEEGDEAHALDLLEQSLGLFRGIGDKYGAAFALCILANISSDGGEREHAASLLTESFQLREEIGDKHGLIECVEGLARIALARNEPAEAVYLLGAAASARERLGIRLSPIEERKSTRSSERARAMLDEKVFAEKWADGSAESFDEILCLVKQRLGISTPRGDAQFA